jgi:hypothetical protein
MAALMLSEVWSTLGNSGSERDGIQADIMAATKTKTNIVFIVVPNGQDQLAIRAVPL